MSFNLMSFLMEKRPCSIAVLPWPAHLRLLVLAPHPDDFDAIGVTLRFLMQKGNTLDVVVSRTGSGVEDEYRPGLNLEGKADLRECEQRASLRFFGLPESCMEFLSFDNDMGDQLIDNPANLAKIEKVLQEKSPDLVFLPHGNDTNSGHQAMHSLFKQAAPRCGRPFVAFLNRDAKTVAMRTDVYLPFGPDQARWKGELLRFHDSQQQRNLRTRGSGFDDRVMQLNARTAGELHISELYSEAFEMECYTMPAEKL
ncbi:MAG: PIG-L family deacetylase [bacterium]